MNSPIEYRRWMTWMLVTLLLAASCAPPVTVEAPPPVSDSGEEPAEAANPAPTQHPLAGETWEVSYIAGGKVGYTHTAAEPVVIDGRRLFRISSRSEMQLKRFGESTSQAMELTSWETADGQVVRFEAKLTDGKTVVATEGRIEGGTLNLALSTQGKTENVAVPWQASWGGFFAMEESLRRQPMKSGQRRSLQAFLPIFNQVGDIRLAALGEEQTQLLSGSQRLLKINSTVKVSGHPIESVLWTDAAGEVLKMVIPGLGQTSYRADKETALATAGQGEYDLGEASVVKVKRHLPRPHETKRIVYRATLERGNARDVFVSSPWQRVRPIDEKTVEIEVRSSRLADPAELDAEAVEPPGPNDLAPNNLLQSDDPKVVKLAREAAPAETDPWKTAVSLEKLVHERIQTKNFSRALATAAEVAETLEGDCTEHAVLLAALCRARGIPARVAIGLVYYAAEEAFAYHMWTEVWADGHWRPLDATLGRGGIGAAHLKLAHSNLKGGDAYSAFLPVFSVLGRLKLELVDVQWPASRPAPQGGGETRAKAESPAAKTS